MDIDKVKRFLKEKEFLAQKKRKDELIRVAKKLGDLKNTWQTYNVKRVYLYGSIIDGAVHKESDIDIAVEGDLEYPDLLHLFSEVDKFFDRDIDLRMLDELPFKENIRKKGVIVYEQ